MKTDTITVRKFWEAFNNDEDCYYGDREELFRIARRSVQDFEESCRDVFLDEIWELEGGAAGYIKKENDNEQVRWMLFKVWISKCFIVSYGGRIINKRSYWNDGDEEIKEKWNISHMNAGQIRDFLLSIDAPLPDALFPKDSNSSSIRYEKDNNYRIMCYNEAFNTIEIDDEIDCIVKMKPKNVDDLKYKDQRISELYLRRQQIVNEGVDDAETIESVLERMKNSELEEFAELFLRRPEIVAKNLRKRGYTLERIGHVMCIKRDGDTQAARRKRAQRLLGDPKTGKKK